MPLPVVQPPPERAFTPHVYYGMTKSLCAVCKGAVDAKVQVRDSKVYFSKFCPQHGKEEVLVASSAEWYLDALSFVAPNAPPKNNLKPVSDKGCPQDCGPCTSHQQRTFLPTIPITSACNLDCPICFTINKNESAHRLSKDELQKILEHLLAEHPDLDIVNFTGGEPTLHPELPELLAICREKGVERLTISTNGLKLLDEEYVKRLAAVDAHIVLSLDSLDPATDKVMIGADTTRAKLRVLDLCEKHDVPVTLLPAVATGLNDHEIPALFDLVVKRPNLRSLEMQTLTFTGQGGVGFQRSARITIPDLHGWIEKASAGAVSGKDFVPSPLAHPHCYSICYLLCLDGGGYVPFARLMGRAKLFELLEDSLYLEPRERFEEVFRDMIDDLWASPEKVPESERVLATLKRLLREMFPSDRRLTLRERKRVGERATKAIYIHSHMDAENFDVARVMKCCVGVPEADGSNIPTCSYNVLYRERDARFADAGMLDRMKAPAGAGPRPLPMVHGGGNGS